MKLRAITIKKKDKCSESLTYEFLIWQLYIEFVTGQFMYYLYIISIPNNGTIENKILFGILTAAIVAVAAGSFATVLDDIIQYASAAQPGGTGPPPGQQGQQGGNNKAPG